MELQRMSDVLSTTMDNSLVYTDSYTDSYTISPLSTDDENRTYFCEAVLNTFPIINRSDNATLDVTGKKHT